MHIDVKLLKACKKNKRNAQKELYEACYLFLIPMCMRYHRNSIDARAVYNIAFIKIIDHLPNLNIEEVPFVAWARRVMSNTLIDEYRKNKKYNNNISNRDKEKDLEYYAENNTVNKAETDSDENSILRLLDFLKPEVKQVFVLYAIEGYSHKEISEMLQVPLGTSKWRVSIARKELKEMLKKQEENKEKRIAI